MQNYTIIIPVYNEEKSIVKQFKAINDEIQKLGPIRKFEIIAVDDYSSDESKIILEGIKFIDLKIIKNLKNLGYGSSIKNACLESRYDNIVICDCDLSYPIEKLPKLVDKFEKGFDMVIANRKNMEKKESRAKNMLRKFLKFIIFLGCTENIKDPNSGFRIFKKKHLLQDVNLVSNGFSLTASFTFISVFRHRLIKFVDIELNDRIGVSKVRFFKDSLRLLQFLFNIWLRFNPTKFFILLSIIFLSLFLFSFYFTSIILYHGIFLFFTFLSAIIALLKLDSEK